MKVILVSVISLDAKTTSSTLTHQPHWSSKEDQDHFFSLINKNQLLIMGRKTYDHAKNSMHHTKGRLRVVLTTQPEKFASFTIPNVLEFTNQKPQELLKDLEKKGYKKALLLGGTMINTLFAREQLISEVWITLEPYIFGKGKELLNTIPFNIPLQLVSIKKLNQQGTLLLKYKILSQSTSALRKPYTSGIIVK